MFGGFSVWHLLLFLLIVLILFGAGKLPDTARQVGAAINEFKAGLKGKEKDEKADADNTAEKKTPE